MKAANTLNVGRLEKKVTSDQITKIDIALESPAAKRNINGLNRHFQYHSIAGKNFKFNGYFDS